MKVLMQNRLDSFVHKGGDVFQMLNTRKYLQQMGLHVDVSVELTPDLAGYDIVHLFNTTRVHETYIQFLHAKKRGKRVVLSPIYHSMTDIRNYENKNLFGVHAVLRSLLGKTDYNQLAKTAYYVLKYPAAWYSWFIQCKTGYTRQQREVIENSNIILPNSELELRTIQKEVFDNMDTSINSMVIYNGVESAEQKEDSLKITDYLKNKNLTDYLVCCGRIEPRKNQLNIIKALKNERDIKIVFAGAINKMHMNYASEFNRLININGNMFYLGEISQSDVMTLNKYARASILASWFETTGLVGLESGLTDCNVVITERGYTKEYYGACAWYCDPENEESIRNAVISAIKAPRGQRKLREHILRSEFTWQKAAERTLEAYNKVMRTS